MGESLNLSHSSFTDLGWANFLTPPAKTNKFLSTSHALFSDFGMGKFLNLSHTSLTDIGWAKFLTPLMLLWDVQSF